MSYLVLSCNVISCPVVCCVLRVVCRQQVKTLSAEETLAVAKAFSHFFSLANAADNHHR